MVSRLVIEERLREVFSLALGQPAGGDWREGLLNLLLRVILILGPLVYFPSLYMCYVGGYVLIGVTDTIAIVAFIGLYYLRGLRYATRASGYALICYMLGTVLLISLGPISQIYLFGFSIITGLLLGLRAGLAGVAINGVTLLCIGLAGAASPNMAAVWDQNPLSWIVITANFLMMNAILVIAIGAIIATLENALAHQKQARTVAEHSAAKLTLANRALESEVEEHRRTEDELAASLERFHVLSRATTDAVWDWDLSADTLWWNEGFEALFGLLPGEEAPDIGAWARRIHPDDRKRVTESLHAAVAGNVEQWSEEYRFLKRDGVYAHVLDRGHLIRAESGGPLRMIGGMSDLTERKKLEEQFLRAQRMESIGTLAGGIAHDLNTVLAPILMATDMLPDHVQGQEGRAMLDMVRVSAQRGADLVQQVLGFARGIEGVRRVVAPGEIARDFLKVIQDTFPRNIVFELNAPDDIWPIQADPTQIHQVLMNLCVNARDAMPDGGRLTLTLENSVVDDVYSGMNLRAKPGPYVRICVQDTGEGMSDETKEKIFEPFFTTKEVGKGTGLGLSTTFSIVRGHGGFINLYSEPGRGTRFWVYLPAEIATAEGESVQETQVLPRGNGELVLLVDDEESIREATGKALVLFGYRVMTASNGAEAVSVFVRNRDAIDVVLTDMSMPVMDGASMIAALRTIEPKVRIVASSGLSDNGKSMKLAGCHAVEFVPKPYTAETLLKTLRDVLKQDFSSHEGDLHEGASHQ
jgi:PAS domain S-box-containing protein